MSMDTERDCTSVQSELTTNFGCETTPCTLGESILGLCYATAFSHLSCSPCTPPVVALDGPCSQVTHTSSSPGQDISHPLSLTIDDPSNGQPLSTTKPVASVTLARSTSPLPSSSPCFVDDIPLDCMVPGPLHPLPSPPVPTSSPPNFFTSSPTRNFPNDSPPTSPVLTDNLEPTFSPAYKNPLKRTRSQEAAETSTDDDSRTGPVNKKLKAYEPPQPKRNTHLSQRREHAKLKTPFRSPVTVATKDCPRYKDTAPSSEPDLPPPPVPPSQNSVTMEISSPHKPEDTMARVRTPRASAPFKSPLSTASGSDMVRVKRAVSASPNVQALQLRLQTLKRAIKIRNDGEGDKLEKLAKKWMDVAREVAWEVWSVVKDNIQDGSKLGDTRGAFQNNWGWADEAKESGVASAGRSGAEDEMQSEEEGPPVPEDTMSVMLRKMGIDPSTLGWDEEEGEFMDVSC